MAHKLGRVYIGTDKGIFPYSLLRKSAIKKSSKQASATSKTWITQHGLVERPYSTETLLSFYESNPILFACINQIAQDVAGLGWSILIKDGAKENESELDRINKFIANPNGEDSFRNILKQILVDWGSIGWLGIEVVRNIKGDIAEIYRVPAHTIHVHREKKKYCQIRKDKKVWFKKFGIEENYSSETGKLGDYDEDKRANELIFYRNFYPKSDYYGAPNFISSIGDLIGLLGVRDYNLNFFENYGVPASIIVLDGEWETGSEKKISQFINTEIRGTENAHRTLVITQPPKCKFDYTPLVTETKEASFRIYRQDLRENILVAYSMPPERIGIRIVGKLGGNVAEEATKIYIQAVVEPLQLDLEEIINEKLLHSEIYKFQFNDIDLRDYTALVEWLIKEVSAGIITPNEARNELGLKPYPEGNKFYIQAGLVEVGETAEESKLTEDEDEKELQRQAEEQAGLDNKKKQFNDWSERQVDLIKAGRKIRGEID